MNVALSANSRGMLALTACMAVFATNDLIVKKLIHDLPVGQVLFLRGVLTFAMLALAAGFGRDTVAMMRAAAANGQVMARTVAESLATTLFTVALLGVPIAAASAIVMMSPLIIAAISVVFLGEQMGWRRWTAVAAGFIGVLLVVQPSPGAFNPWILIAVATAVSSAARDLLTKSIDPRLPIAVVSMMSVGGVGLAGLGISLFEGWQPIDLPAVVAMVAMAFLLAVGNFFMVLAFRGADVAVIAPFRYSYLLWAGLGGAIFFGEVLDRIAVLGASLIVLSGLYTIHRERVRRLERESQP